MPAISPRTRLLLILVAAGVVLAAGAAALGFRPHRAAAGVPPAANSPAGVPVVVATVVRQDVPHRVSSIGTVQSLHSVVIRPQVTGILTEVLFREGDMVARGAPLARIDDRSYAAALAQAQAEKASREAQLKVAQLDLERFGSLAGRQAISRQQIDQQAALVERLKADVLASEASIAAQKVLLSHTRITSPVRGRAGIRRVDPGNLVQASDPQGLVTVTQVDPISVLFTVPQEALASLDASPDRRAQFKVVAFNRDAGVPLAQGRISTFDNQVDPATGTLRLRAEFPNPQGKLWPGQFVAVQLETRVSQNRLVFPARAVQQGLNGPFVFRVADSRAEVVPVAMDYLDDDIAAVAEGLSAGDTVVIDGQTRLKAGSTVRVPAAEGDAHDAGS